MFLLGQMEATTEMMATMEGMTTSTTPCPMSQELDHVPAEIHTEGFERECLQRGGWFFGYMTVLPRDEANLLFTINESDWYDPAMLGEDWAVPLYLLTNAVRQAFMQKEGQEMAARFLPAAWV